MGEGPGKHGTAARRSETAVSRTILVIDDDPAIRMLLSSLLKMRGYRSVTAGDGTEAEQKLAAHTIDLILLDLIMPGRSGLEMIDTFKQTYPGIPIVVVTGCGKVEFATEAFKKGAVDFLTKPLTPAKLYEVTEKALQVVTPSSVNVLLGQMPTIGSYRFVDLLGEGNIGIVYKVERVDAGGGIRQFALKLLKKSAVGTDGASDNIRRHFLNEAKAVFSIQHPNIIKIYEYGAADDQTPYIVMELLNGRPLDQLNTTVSLCLHEKCRILMQVAAALEIIHCNGICHRDIKPNNVMVEDNLTTKIMDFGVARLKDSTLTPTAHIYGTPSYLPPEAFVTAKVDSRSDIFSFGVLSYEVLTGHLPFGANTVAELAREIINTTPPSPRELGIALPPELDHALEKMLAKEPDQRYGDAGELVTLFKRFAE